MREPFHGRASHRATAAELDDGITVGLGAHWRRSES